MCFQCEQLTAAYIPDLDELIDMAAQLGNLTPAQRMVRISESLIAAHDDDDCSVEHRLCPIGMESSLLLAIAVERLLALKQSGVPI